MVCCDWSYINKTINRLQTLALLHDVQLTSYAQMIDLLIHSPPPTNKQLPTPPEPLQSFTSHRVCFAPEVTQGIICVVLCSHACITRTIIML